MPWCEPIKAGSITGELSRCCERFDGVRAWRNVGPLGDCANVMREGEGVDCPVNSAAEGKTMEEGLFVALLGSN